MPQLAQSLRGKGIVNHSRPPRKGSAITDCFLGAGSVPAFDWGSVVKCVLRTEGKPICNSCHCIVAMQASVGTEVLHLLFNHLKKR